MIIYAHQLNKYIFDHEDDGINQNGIRTFLKVFVQSHGVFPAPDVSKRTSYRTNEMITYPKTMIICCKFSRTRAYFLVSELTTIAKERKILGKHLVTNLIAQNDNHTSKKPNKSHASDLEICFVDLRGPENNSIMIIMAIGKM